MLRRDLTGTFQVGEEWPLPPVPFSERVELWHLVDGTTWKLMARCLTRDARRIASVLGGRCELRPMSKRGA